MTTVYAFPPVRVTASAFPVLTPINESRSLFTGARFVSAAQRSRRVPRLTVAALGGDSAGAGFMENLRILLNGGVNLVRLDSRPINWWVDSARLRDERQSQPLNWSTATDPALEWVDGGAVDWFTGRPLLATAVTDGAGFPALSITGGPANTLIARPGDLVTLFSPVTATTGSTARVMTVARTDAAGAATIRLMSALSGSGRVNLGTSETGVYELVSMSDPMQPTRGQWSYDLSFREVFEDEVAGGFVEVDPW